MVLKKHNGVFPKPSLCFYKTIIMFFQDAQICMSTYYQHMRDKTEYLGQ